MMAGTAEIIGPMFGTASMMPAISASTTAYGTPIRTSPTQDMKPMMRQSSN